MAQRTSAQVWIAEHLALACGGVFVVILFIGYVALFVPELGRIRAADRLGLLRQEVQDKQAYLSKLQQLQQNFDGVPKEDVDRLLAMIPSKQDVPGILAALEASANASSLSMTAVNFSSGAAPAALASVPGLQTVTIALTLEHGDYQHFKLFLEALEQNLRLFDVGSVTLNPSGAQYTMILRAYVRANAT